MMRKYRVLVAVLAALGTVELAVPAASAKAHEVPFRAFYGGSVAFTGPTTVLFSGAGNATHLGRGENDGQVEITGASPNCSGELANVNTETLTAANGDTLTLTSDDVACPLGPGVFSGTGHWVVTGGTGRFSGATGHGTLEGLSDFNQGVFDFQLTGVISAPHGN